MRLRASDNLRTLVLPLLLGLGVAAVWFASSPATATDAGPPLDPVTLIERLRHNHRPADALPPEASIGEHVVAEDARLLSAGGDSRFFVAPGRRGDVCVVGAVTMRPPVPDRDEEVAVTCSDPAVFADRGMYLSMGPYDAHHAVLVFPDDVEYVRVPGAASPLPATSNHIRFGPFAYDVDPLDDGASVRYATVELIAGEGVVEVPVPAAAVGHVAGG